MKNNTYSLAGKLNSISFVNIPFSNYAIHILLVMALIFVSDYSIASGKNKIDNGRYESKIDSLLSKMTIEEKAGQLNQLSGGWFQGISAEQKQLIREGKVGSFLNVIGANLTREVQKIAVEETRLKIPILFAFDVIHGYQTTFPIPLAEAASWEPEIVTKASSVQAREAAAAGVHWTFTPMVDIARDPRWGRIAEGSGEDPYLGSVMAAARVKGFQGDNSFNNTSSIIACAKHFAAYGAAEGGRDYNTVDISERTLREIYLRPFKAALDAGVETFMCSFNEIGGIPSSANEHLLNGILKNEWGFKGFVVSDWNSIGELVNHGIAADLKEAALLSIRAGLDMDMFSGSYVSYLPELVKEKKIDVKIVDEAVRRILRVKYKLGLFDNPYKYCNPDREKKEILSKENINIALEEAQKSIVLLKNQNQILPLKKGIKTIAVIGPLADAKQEPLGSWEQLGDSNNVVSLLEGIKSHVDNSVEVMYNQGCTITGESKEGFKDAVRVATAADVIILAVGESGHMSGEARSRSSISLPGVQEELIKEIHKTGKPYIIVLMNGRPLAISWEKENSPAIIESWFLGLQAGNAIADVIFGNYNPSGKLPVTFPISVGQIPIYYNYKNTGRPGNDTSYFTSKYRDLPVLPLYPFGYGLSYAKFEYGKINLSSKTIKMDGTLHISINVKNSGMYDGEEVVQLYVRDISGSVTRPVKELKGFKKVFIKKGEEKNIDFTLTQNDLAFYGRDMKFMAEPGLFKVFIGTNSAEVKEEEFELTD